MCTLCNFVTWQNASGISPETIRLRNHYLRRLVEQFPDQDPLTLSIDQLATYLSRRGWKAETRKSARASIRAFYAWATLTGKIDRNPALLLPPIRVPAGRPRPAPDDVFLRAMLRGTSREQLMAMLAAYAGLRRGEIARLHTRDVMGDTLRVVGKGGAERHVPLHPDLMFALSQVEPGWVFPGRQEGHLSPGHVGVMLKRLLGPDWSGHTLRHRFASLAYAAERDLRAVQTLLGHSKPETTARYTAVPDGALRAAVLGTG